MWVRNTENEKNKKKFTDFSLFYWTDHKVGTNRKLNGLMKRTTSSSSSPPSSCSRNQHKHRCGIIGVHRVLCICFTHQCLITEQYQWLVKKEGLCFYVVSLAFVFVCVCACTRLNQFYLYFIWPFCARSNPRFNAAISHMYAVNYFLISFFSFCTKPFEFASVNVNISMQSDRVSIWYHHSVC